MSDDRYTVQHSAEESRYILVDRGEDGTQSKEIGQEANAEVTVDGVASRVMYHTEVSPDYGGQGLASVLVQAAVDPAIGEGFAIAPVCRETVCSEVDRQARAVRRARGGTNRAAPTGRARTPAVVAGFASIQWW